MRYEQRPRVNVACVDYRVSPILDKRNAANSLRGPVINVRNVTGSLTAAKETLQYIGRENNGSYINSMTHRDCKGGQLIVDVQKDKAKLQISEDAKMVYVDPFKDYALKSIKGFEVAAVAVRIATAYRIGIPLQALSAELIDVPQGSAGTNVLAVIPPSDIMYRYFEEEAKLKGPGLHVYVTQMFHTNEIRRDADLAIGILNPDRVVVLTSEKGGTLFTETIAPDPRELEKVLRNSDLYIESRKAARDIRM